jgi:hypothetical protein
MHFLSRRINLLVVEDEVSLLSMLRETFSTPYINIVTASNMKTATNVVARTGTAWHCWIVDMCLGEKKNAGTALIEGYGHFPFAIVYSGLGSMESAAGAIRKGAAAVIDKGTGSLDRLVWEACSLMSLGVLCGGTLRKKKEVLFLLKEHAVRDSSAWAESAGISLRQLENVSMAATGIPPSFAVPFYFGLRYLLAAELGVERKFIAAKESAFYWKCVEYLEENQDYYRNMLFR